MGMKLIDLMPALANRRTFGFFEDFLSYTDAQLITKGTTGGGSSVAISGSLAGGVMLLTTGGTQNNEAYLSTTNSPFLMANNVAMIFESAQKWTEANTNTALVAAGFESSFGTGALQNGTSGPPANFSGAIIYKQSGTNFWKCCSSLGTTQTINTSSSAPVAATYETLRVEIRAVSSTVAEVAFFRNNSQLLDSTTLKPIKHNVTYTGAVAMKAGVYANTNSSSSEVISLDYVAAYGLRDWAGIA